MPHTHHSHSGSFCNHAVDELEAIVEHAFGKGMTTVSLTEHVPRPDHQLYPGELESGWNTDYQLHIFERYMKEAIKIRTKVDARRIAVDASPEERKRQVLVGFESEWIDGDANVAASRIQQILDKYGEMLDFWIGSVHHVAGEPIDFDADGYQRALQTYGGDEDELCLAYFDAQQRLLTRLQPPVVGHFDLIRLMSSHPDLDWKHRAQGRLWEAIERNLRVIQSYGGVLEVNTSALRKGLDQPYPRCEIMELWCGALGGTLVLSDDSHGIVHIGTYYHQVLGSLRRAGVTTIGVLNRKPAKMRTISLQDFESHPFWAT